MANQNPQPEIYTTKHFFNGTVEGATNTQTVFTQQANNEEVRIYGFSVDITDVAGATYATNVDFDYFCVDQDPLFSFCISMTRLEISVKKYRRRLGVQNFGCTSAITALPKDP